MFVFVCSLGEHVCVFVCVLVWVSMYVCVCVFVWASMYVCLCIACVSQTIYLLLCRTWSRVCLCYVVYLYIGIGQMSMSFFGRYWVFGFVERFVRMYVCVVPVYVCARGSFSVFVCNKVYMRAVYEWMNNLEVYTFAVIFMCVCVCVWS